MVNHIKFMSQLVPGPKYDIIPCTRITKPKIFALKFLPKTERDKIPTNKIPKSKGPDIGTYELIKAYTTTQIGKKSKNMFIEKCPNKNFMEHHLKNRKFTIAPGHYKGVEKAFDR